MLTKKVFNDLAIYMIGFGVLMGIVFPFFVVAATTVPPQTVLNPLFFGMCIAAGFLVGLLNIFLAKKIVGAKMKQLSGHMKHVEKRLMEKPRGSDCWSDENCYIKVVSDDEIGDSARAFNALVKALSQALRSETSVREFTELLSSRLDLEQLADQALSRLMENLDAYGGAIIIEKDDELSILSAYGINNPHVMLESDMVSQVFKSQKRVVVSLPEDVFITGVLLDFRPKSVLLEPILYKGVVLGAVVLAGTADYACQENDNMWLFGQGLAMAFKNALTHAQLQKLAANDPLTGVLNRRFGLERFKDEFVRAVKTGQPLGVLMLDIDHFKRINDTYGHLVGDKVLINLAHTVKAALREGDIFLRYGGEEFVTILPGASAADTMQIAEKIRRLTEDTQLKHNSQIIKITVSLGGASFPETNADGYMSLINTADANLYKAKENGRNNTIVE